MEQGKEYFAFISYQREDEEWAKWLAHELEHYHLPLSLNGREDLPHDLRPIFRDVDELSAGNLPQQIHQALENAAHLIVICSPRSAKSPWVNKEIEEFISMGKTDKIFPFIIEGVAMCKDSEDPLECFPPALRNLPKDDERLGANVNENGHGSNILRTCDDCPIKDIHLKDDNKGDINEKGRDAAVVKSIAGMLGLSFDTLWQRYEREKAEEERKLKEQRDNLLRVQSRFLAEKVNMLIEEGNSYMATLLALNTLPKDLDNPDRPYVPEAELALRSACCHDNAILYGHTGAVLNASYSLDGKYIVSASKDKSIRIWNARTGRPIGDPLEGHTEFVNSVAFSPDGKHIVSASHDKTIRIWDVKTGKQVGEPLKGHTRQVYSASYSVDGNYIVSASADKTIRIWDAKTGEQVGCPLKGHMNFVRSAYFSPDGKRIVSASYDFSIKIWDVETSEQVKSLEKHTFFVKSASFSPNGKYIVSASQDNTIIIWNVEMGNSMVIEGHADYVNSATFSPDGKYIVSASKDKTIRIWDAETGRQVGETLEGHNEEVYSASFSPDGRHVVSASEDGTIRIWEFSEYGKQNYSSGSIVNFGYSKTDVFKADWRVRKLFQGSNKLIKSVSFSPDREYVVSAFKDKTIKIWEVKTGRTVGKILDGGGENIIAAFSHDKKFIFSISEDNTIRIWDYKKGQQVGTPLKGLRNETSTVSFSPDGKSYASSCPDGTIRIWEIISTASFDPEGKSFVFASSDGDVRLLYVTKCGVKDSGVESTERYDDPDSEFFGSEKLVERLMKEHVNLMISASFSPDGKYIVSASEDKTIRIWNSETGVQIGKILDAYSDDVYVSFSLDSKYVAFNYKDGPIKIKEVKLIDNRGCKLENAAVFGDLKSYSPDGNYIVTAKGNYTITIHNAITNEQVGNPMVGHTDYVWKISYSPDGQYIVSASEDRTIRIWDVKSRRQLGKPLVGHTDAVISASFSPDGRYVISCSKDKTIRIWDASTGKQVCRPIKEIVDDVRDVAFSFSGKFIVSQSWDNTLCIWKFQTLQELIDQEHERYIDSSLTFEERERFYLD